MDRTFESPPQAWNHMFHNVEKKIRSLGVHDMSIAFHWDGKLC